MFARLFFSTYSQRVRQRHVSMRMMVTVRFAVGRDVHELRIIAIAESANQTVGEVLAELSNCSNATAREIGPS